MDIAYNSKALRDLCEDVELAEAKFGRAISSTLLDRLADIDAADTVDDLIAGQLAISKVGKREVLTISLGGGFAIFLEANHNEIPTNKRGEVKWGRIRRLQLLKIERYEI